MTQDFGTVITPDVHLNGTSGEALAEMYELVTHRLNDALVALYAAGPNARDYAGRSSTRIGSRSFVRCSPS
jgi:hypothetical protein